MSYPQIGQMQQIEEKRLTPRNAHAKTQRTSSSEEF
jgi:hypothetical protein